MLIKDRHERIYHLHSASGIWLGYFMYFIVITGCFALFYNETQSWENPANRVTVAEDPVDISPIFSAWVAENEKLGELTFVAFDNANPEHPYFGGRLGLRVEGQPVEFKDIHWDTRTGEVIEHRGEGVTFWLYNLHRDLNWPKALGGRQIGRALAGLAGVILLMSIISGILIHSKILKEIFTMRFYRSVRLKWQDAHKVIGVWGIPPFAMFALTGAYLGIITLLAPATAFLTVNGDQEKLIEAVIGKPVEAAGEAAQMISVAELAAMRMEDNPSQAPRFITFTNWGDVNAQVNMLYKADTELLMYEQQTRSAVTGEIVSSGGEQVLEETVPGMVIAAYAPLHYGTYGGLALKFLYLIAGLALAVMTALGLMLWVERRLHGKAGQKSEAYYIGLSRFTTGAVMGVPLATAAVLGYDRVYAGAEEARFAAIGSAYFIVIGLSVLYAFVRRNDYRSAKELMGITGLAFVLAAVLNTATTVGGLPALLGASVKSAAYVDLSFVIIGALLVFISVKLPAVRPEKKRQSNMDDDLIDVTPVTVPAE